MLGRSVQLFICRILDFFLLETILAWPQCYCHVTINSCFAELCAHCLDLLEQGSVDTFSKSMAQVTVCLGRGDLSPRCHGLLFLLMSLLLQFLNGVTARICDLG